ncbi:hypothetical protein V6N11_065466 [Hibiscus sabdariffa]|uniref:Uncharacterized protein n=1 Tax=Hibiscus sabdariffa TaxID=183260 RepID=A0ABR2PHD9_9ROSI
MAWEFLPMLVSSARSKEESTDGNQVHPASEYDALHPDTYPEAFSVPPSEAISSAHMDSTRVIDAGCTSSEPVVAPVLEEPLLCSPCLSPLLSQDNEVSVDGSNGSTEHVQNQAPESPDDETMNNEPLADVPVCTATNSNVHSMITRSKADGSRISSNVNIKCEKQRHLVVLYA